MNNLMMKNNILLSKLNNQMDKTTTEKDYLFHFIYYLEFLKNMYINYL